MNVDKPNQFEQAFFGGLLENCHPATNQSQSEHSTYL
jgi:hypothetical protein